MRWPLNPSGGFPPCTRCDPTDDEKSPACGTWTRSASGFSETNIRADANQTGMALAEAAVSSLSDQPVIDQLWVAGLGIVNNEDVKKTDTVLNGEWVSRGTVEVRFNIATTRTSDNGYIETATATGTVDGVAMPAITLG